MARPSKNKKHPFRIRHKKIYDAVFIVLLLTSAVTMTWFLVKSTSFMLFGTIITHVETDEKVVALTLDDGPLPGTTEETLAALKQNNVKATFFVVGTEVRRHEDQLKKIIADGHEVGNHSYSHKSMALMFPSDVANEIERNDQLIRDAGYTGAIPFRAPYNVKFVALPFYLMLHGRPDISRDVITKEGTKVTAEAIATDIVRQVKPGSIILLHPMYTHTATSRKALAGIITRLRAEGYTFVTVSELLAYESP